MVLILWGSSVGSSTTTREKLVRSPQVFQRPQPWCKSITSDLLVFDRAPNSRMCPVKISLSKTATGETVILSVFLFFFFCLETECTAHMVASVFVFMRNLLKSMNTAANCHSFMLLQIQLLISPNFIEFPLLFTLQKLTNIIWENQCCTVTQLTLYFMILDCPVNVKCIYCTITFYYSVLHVLLG